MRLVPSKSYDYIQSGCALNAFSVKFSSFSVPLKRVLTDT